MRRLLAPLGLVLAAGTALLALPVRDWVGALLSRVAALGPWAPFAMAALYAALTVAMVPGSALTLASGLLFGLSTGFLVVTAGANLGALGAFLLARTAFRRRAEALAAERPRLKAIQDAVGREGFRLVLLLRLAPVFPFTLLNVLLGVTAVRTRDYCLGNLIGMIPGTWLFVYLGSLGRAAAAGAGAGPWGLAFRLLGLAATIAVVVVVTRMARRALAGVEGRPA